MCNTQIQMHAYKPSDKGKILTLSPGSPTEPGGPEDPGGPVGPCQIKIKSLNICRQKVRIYFLRWRKIISTYSRSLRSWRSFNQHPLQNPK